MKQLLFASLITLTFCGGKERWDVKTLCDKDAATINFTPIPVTVTHLTQLITPKTLGKTPRQPCERQVYQVVAIVKDFFKEADGDFHIVLQDTAGVATMIAEIPDPTCDVTMRSPYINTFKAVRDSFLTIAKKGGTYCLTGVAFVDIKHPKPQRGVAANEIELHPLLSFNRN